MVRATSTLLAAAAFGLAGLADAPAQSGPTISTMPPPPSASDPAPKEAAKPRKKAPPAARRSEAEEPAEGTRQASARKRGGAATERPSRYVPEEFDRDGVEEGGRARPFMSESGRPGMGMRF